MTPLMLSLDPNLQQVHCLCSSKFACLTASLFADVVCKGASMFFVFTEACLHHIHTTRDVLHYNYIPAGVTAHPHIATHVGK